MYTTHPHTYIIHTHDCIGMYPIPAYAPKPVRICIDPGQGFSTLIPGSPDTQQTLHYLSNSLSSSSSSSSSVSLLLPTDTSTRPTRALFCDGRVGGEGWVAV